MTGASEPTSTATDGLDTTCADELPLTFVTSEDEFFGDVPARKLVELARRLRQRP